MNEGGIVFKIAEPYAEALMSLAQDRKLTDKFGEDAAMLISLVDSSEELRQFLASPIVMPDLKKSVLAELLTGQIDPLMQNFIGLLVDRRRIVFLKDICRQYQILLRALKQAVLAEVTSAVELSEDQQRAVCDRVKTMTGAQHVDLETRIEPDLIGGVIIKVGSQVIDASLRGQLRRISIKLSSNT
jgi:F-type H+-transporting ATPase subunit delta